MTEQEIYQKAIDKWGVNNQCLKAVESMAKLTQSLIQDRPNAIVVSNVDKDIADVEILLSQLRIIYSAKKIDEQKQIKLKRLQETIEKG